MPKTPKPIIKTQKQKEPKAEAKEPKEQPVEEQFGWSGFLVPDMDKLYRFLLVAGISIISFVLFVWIRNISYSSVSYALLDLKSLFFLLVCYVFSCYTAARKIDILKTAALILVPELLIIIYLSVQLKAA